MKYNLKSKIEYWKKRCLLMEEVENKNPCDPDITTEQIEAWRDYHEFIKNNPEPKD